MHVDYIPVDQTVEYRTGCMQTLLDCLVAIFSNVFVQTIWMHICSPFIYQWRSPCISSPRLAIHLILCGAEDAFSSLWACVCSSWVQINQFTSQRSKLLPEGNISREYIQDANAMVSRSLSLILWYFIMYFRHMHAHTHMFGFVSPYAFLVLLW